MRVLHAHPTERTDAERQMQHCWYELVMAEQAGQSQQVLEDLYHLYLGAVEEYLQLCVSHRRRDAS